MVELKRPTLRIQEHIDKLRCAGLDTQMFFDALVGIRDDSVISKDQRDALYKLVAMEGFVWYMEAIGGKHVDRVALAEKAAELAVENAAAIKKRTPGDTATALLDSSVKRAPADAATRLDRPPPRKK